MICIQLAHHKPFQAPRSSSSKRRAFPPLLARASAAPVGRQAGSSGEIVEVAALKGVRVLKNEDGSPRVEYLVAWKDDSPDTWWVAAGRACV